MGKKKRKPLTLERAVQKFLHHRVIFRENATNLYLWGTVKRVRKLGSEIVVDINNVVGRGNNVYTMPVKQVRNL